MITSRPYIRKRIPTGRCGVGDAAERKAVGFITVILGVEIATMHVQVVRVTTTVSRGRPPVPEGVLVGQVTIAPVVVAREHIRKRTPTGYCGAERKSEGLTRVILGAENATIHGQVVRVTTTVSRGRPPVPGEVLVVQVTIAPVVVA